jgi:hypothetical protein
LSFPRFSGVDPGIWVVNCEDYFNVYRVPEAMKVTVASMNMEGNTTRWMQYFRLKHGLGTWRSLSRAVMLKFGVDEYPKAMRRLQTIKQRETLEEYVQDFEEARYDAIVHNPGLDDAFLVNQFILGLKHEMQGAVMAQLSTIVDRAVLLAQVQQEIMDRSRSRFSKPVMTNRSGGTGRSEGKGGLESGNWSKERQLKEYRRVNGLCYTCGEKYEPGHQARCGNGVVAHLNMLTAEDMARVLSLQRN